MSRTESNRNDVPEMVNTEIELFTLIHDILINWWCILLGAIAAAMIAYVVVNVQYVPEYTTMTTFVVGSKGSNNTYSNLSSANTMAQTFEKILKSSVMEKTICDKLKVDEIDAKGDRKSVV